ncbi:MAG: bifunctional UDP-N-acetylmuramoyl-tripeptide:D-alanyl-D-alanine ligase/alanine racemase [Muribaculaceae bacterium]|nr:bifunctional UDP-N-acetylmuramoyl-tripeptide:D-alanyl-D-alanine ligase/alanine racemase [Muribaculaceae bacterium]
MKYSIQEIAEMMGARGASLQAPDADVSQLLTDSRSLVLPAETLFFALPTAQDSGGQRYVRYLYDQGVRSFVVETLDEIDDEVYSTSNILHVPSVLDALQNLATEHRMQFDIPIIGITGTRGKTTVKEWLYQLLCDDYRIVRSPRSFNSQIGVPLSLWDIDDDTTLAIIEAGISRPGEMARLHSMIRPTMGVVTNIAPEPEDEFGDDMDRKAAEKAKILYNCQSIVYRADDLGVRKAIKPLLDASDEAPIDIIAWSKTDPDKELFVELVSSCEHRTELNYTFAGEQHTLTLPMTDAMDVNNAITCLAVMLNLGIAPEVIAQRMVRLMPVGTRINVIEGVNDCTIITDEYPNDFVTLTPAVNFMMRRAGNRRSAVILSDLNPEAIEPHVLYSRVRSLMRAKQIDRFYGIGPEMCRQQELFASLPEAHFFGSTAQFLSEMAQGDFDDETVLVKGGKEFDFGQILDMLEAKQHQTVEEIDLNALAHNFKLFKSLIKPTTRTVAMVKASGYGTGSYEVAKTLQDRGADYLAVAVQDEGVQLRKAGITMPIIVLNPMVTNYKSLFTLRLEPEVYSLEMCRQLIKEGARYQTGAPLPIHIKVDTGMHRLGFTLEQLPAVIELLQDQHIVQPASVFSHLSVADVPGEDEYTLQQFSYFDQCAGLLRQHYPTLPRHILNTAGIVRFPERQMEMVRIGIGLYGMRTVDDPREDALQPVATLQSVVISIKQWPAGTTIGYGRRGVLQRDSRIATVPIGYADGLDRRYGNGAIALWAGGKRCPTVGNVCMDAVMIDVTDTDVQVGDHVEVFGRHIAIDELARVRGTISYEVLTSVSTRVKRVYYRE